MGALNTAMERTRKIVDGGSGAVITLTGVLGGPAVEVDRGPGKLRIALCPLRHRG